MNALSRLLARCSFLRWLLLCRFCCKGRLLCKVADATSAAAFEWGFRFLGIATLLIVMALPAGVHAALGYEQTVIIRVVATSPAWGQEPSPGWPNSSPVKDADGYSLYDLEIGRDTSNVPNYVSLYKFTGWSPDFPFLPADQLVQYWNSSRIRSAVMQSGVGTSPASTQVIGVLQDMVSLVLQREHPTRVVIEYSGHGSPFSFFEGAVTISDAKLFLSNVRQQTSGIPLILDFSTNCDVGYFDFAINYYPYADYLLASEKTVGGFDPTDPGPFDYWISNQHDNNLHRFWQRSNSLDQAFDAIVSARQSVWYAGRQSIVTGNVEQSLTIYKFGMFDSLMNSLAHFNGFNPDIDLPRNSDDIATYVYATKDSSLIADIERFRIRYASDRNIIAWNDDSKGFSVYDKVAFSNYLELLRKAPPAPPVCTLSAAPSKVRKNGTSILTPTCTPAATTYLWTGGTCEGTTAPACTVTPAATTSYSVIGTNSYGSSTANAQVTVKAVDLTPILMLLLD